MEFTTIAQARKQTGLSYLGGINLSAKLIKNKKIGYYTYSLNLSPANTSGFNVCPFSTPECRLSCLATSGRTAVEIYSGRNIIQNCRINKTKLFYNEPEFFISWLIAEIKMYQKKAIRDGYLFSIRLNTISDIDWQNVKINGRSIFEIFSDVAFYDYTKNFNKFNNKPSNYHLTYSYTGRNWNKCKELLQLGYNIAMVFNIKHETELPATYKGYVVINGDANDFRPLDGNGVIVGLKWKRIANKEVEKRMLQSCFVIQPNDVNCQYANVHENELILI
jgi:hypothetical protein